MNMLLPEMIQFDEDLYQFASYLTDPICKTREYAYRAEVVEALNPTDSKVANFARKCFCYLAAVFFAFLAVFTTLPGGAIRGMVNTFKAEPFVVEGGQGKVLGEDRLFSLLSWNICGVPGGYSISDGGVTPIEDRIDRVIREIEKRDADINCFMEVFDAKTCKYLKEELKKHGYTHFYTNIGTKALGTSSGIVVASKYSIENAEFLEFPKETLVGRTKWSSKGVFGFDLVSEGHPFARIFVTHLQHSEIPEYKPREAKPEETEERLREVEGRRQQMKIIVNKVRQVANRCVVVTGDLNMDDEEVNLSDWQNMFIRDQGFVGMTWAGDEFCAKLVGKRISGPLNLDHTLVQRGTAQSVHTSLVRTGYQPAIYSPKALSDHEGVYTEISI